MRPLAACVGACLLLAGLPGIATAAEAERVLLPRPERTPGDVLPECNSATLRQHGYSHSVRPPPGFTRKVKREQLRADYQGGGLRSGCLEEDHLVPIGWCGNPNSERNLWPQLRAACGAPAGASAEAKDDCEYLGSTLLKRDLLDLHAAQAGIAHDWISYCRDVVEPLAAQHHIGLRHREADSR